MIPRFCRADLPLISPGFQAPKKIQAQNRRDSSLTTYLNPTFLPADVLLAGETAKSGTGGLRSKDHLGIQRVTQELHIHIGSEGISRADVFCSRLCCRQTKTDTSSLLKRMTKLWRGGGPRLSGERKAPKEGSFAPRITVPPPPSPKVHLRACNPFGGG